MFEKKYQILNLVRKKNAGRFQISVRKKNIDSRIRLSPIPIERRPDLLSPAKKKKKEFEPAPAKNISPDKKKMNFLWQMNFQINCEFYDIKLFSTEME